MLPQPAPAPQCPRRFGVGIDPSRYGHCAAFLRDDLQPAADVLAFAASAAGYARLRQRLEQLAQRHGPARFVVRVDAAGQYADNLLHFLHGLGGPGAGGAPAPLDLVVSCGDPQRNKNYRAAVFGSQKSDPVEARAAAGGDRPFGQVAIADHRAPAGGVPAVLMAVDPGGDLGLDGLGQQLLGALTKEVSQDISGRGVVARPAFPW